LKQRFICQLIIEMKSFGLYLTPVIFFAVSHGLLLRIVAASHFQNAFTIKFTLAIPVRGDTNRGFRMDHRLAGKNACQRFVGEDITKAQHLLK
jgi:hypothetical protein